jgi:hypothetical protein
MCCLWRFMSPASQTSKPRCSSVCPLLGMVPVFPRTVATLTLVSTDTVFAVGVKALKPKSLLVRDRSDVPSTGSNRSR